MTPIPDDPDDAIPDTVSTAQLAAWMHVGPRAVQAYVKRNGSYFGLVPIRLANRRIRFDRKGAIALAQGRKPDAGEQ